MSIPFDQINAVALAQLENLAADLFPQGVRKGNELVLGSINGEPGRSFSLNLRTGKFADFSADIKGGDPIALWAYKFHGGDRVSAARALGNKLGFKIEGNIYIAPEGADEAVKVAATKTADDWQPMDPRGAAEPKDIIARFQTAYRYNAADGSVIGYVLRSDVPGERKKILPLNYGSRSGVIGWHHKHLPAPRPLFGLELIAANPSKPILIVEGEKACLAAEVLFPEYLAVTWQAGSSNVKETDWSPLDGREIVIWPDCDIQGYVAASEILANFPDAHVLNVLDDELGSDAADLQVADPQDWLSSRHTDARHVLDAVAAFRRAGIKLEGQLPSADWIAENQQPRDTLDEEPPPFEDSWDGEPEIPEAPARVAPPIVEQDGVIPLGHDRGNYFYYSLAGKQVHSLTATQHNKNTFASLASVAHFWQRNPAWLNSKNQVIWDEVVDTMMGQCRAIGIYNPERIRGRGAWLDEGRSVLHNGDKLIVDGEVAPLLLEGSKYIYEAAQRLSTDYREPLSNADAYKLVEICKYPNWQHGINGLLYAGFIAVAPICGALYWRPSIWVTGSSGSGKSWLLQNVMVRSLGGVALIVQSKTSEAGIRQALGCDALPVLFDEAEREDAAAAQRMQGVLDLLRQASSEGGAEIIKGTKDQNSVKRFRIRSCFMLSSINVGIEHAADESRITTLAIMKRAESDDEAFDAINRYVQDTITPAYASGLLSRSVRLLPIIRANAETFAKAVAVVFGSRRTGDQLGALLAGAYSLHSDRAISDEAAEAWVRKQDWTSAAESDTERDELRLVSHLTQHRHRIAAGGSNGANVEVTVGAMLLAAAGRHYSVAADIADEQLKSLGIRYDMRDGKMGVYVSTNHPGLKKIMVNTPWSSGWARSLGRLDGAVSGEQKSRRFAFGHVSKAVWVPMEAIDVAGE